MAEKGFRLSLNNHELAEEFFENTRLLGIIAPIKDYQFCWHINSTLGMDFRINHDIEIQLKRKKRDYFFTVFEYAEPTGSLVNYLYKNQFDGEYLLPEFKHFDFLWLMKGDTVPDDVLLRTTTDIKSIHGVQLVTELTHEKIRNKEHLVF
jgi:hypothetical protein